MKQKIQDTSVDISRGGRIREYWGLRVMNPKRAEAEDGSKEVDMTAILKRYNIKGFEFGNWTSNEDRYDMVIAFERAAKVLETIVGSRNLGMDMLLGVAFGARGRGGAAAAHYEPGLNMINLTKTTGFGCLAHEWGHAIDYNLGRFVDQNKVYDALTGGYSVARLLPENTGAQLRRWANAVVDEAIASDSHKRLADADEYWHRRTEVWARYFEQYICYMCRLKKLQPGYLTQPWSYYVSARAYWTEADFMKIAKGSMFSFMIVLKGVLNNKYELTAQPYMYADRKKLYPTKDKQPLSKPKAEQPRKAASKAVKKGSKTAPNMDKFPFTFVYEDKRPGKDWSVIQTNGCASRAKAEALLKETIAKEKPKDAVLKKGIAVARWTDAKGVIYRVHYHPNN